MNYNTDGRSLSPQKNTQSRSSSRNTLTMTRRDGSAQGGMLEGMESSPRPNNDQTHEDGKQSVCLQRFHFL